MMLRGVLKRFCIFFRSGLAVSTDNIPQLGSLFNVTSDLVENVLIMLRLFFIYAGL